MIEKPCILGVGKTGRGKQQKSPVAHTAQQEMSLGVEDSNLGVRIQSPLSYR